VSDNSEMAKTVSRLTIYWVGDRLPMILQYPIVSKSDGFKRDFEGAWLWFSGDKNYYFRSDLVEFFTIETVELE
jgi:hypothetical protein